MQGISVPFLDHDNVCASLYIHVLVCINFSAGQKHSTDGRGFAGPYDAELIPGWSTVTKEKDYSKQYHCQNEQTQQKGKSAWYAIICSSFLFDLVIKNRTCITGNSAEPFLLGMHPSKTLLLSVKQVFSESAGGFMPNFVETMHNISSTLFLLKIFRRVLWSSGHASVIFGGLCFGLHIRLILKYLRLKKILKICHLIMWKNEKKNEVSHNRMIIEIN